jgi:molybdopterin molybdotransferase
MISVEDAERLIAENLFTVDTEMLSIYDARGRVLREDVRADRPHPPFHRVSMDGIAICYSEWEAGRRDFPVAATQGAGQPAVTLDDISNCVEIMTGAVLPVGTDCVIRVEDIIVNDGVATIDDAITLKFMQNVHQLGSDQKKGDVLLEAGCTVLAPQIAVLASVGKINICVGRQLKAAVVSTGDELVDIDQTPAEYQIRKSNVHAVSAALEQHHVSVERFHFNDDREVLTERLRELVDTFDLLVLSGGVSMGKFDYVPAALSDCGVTAVFHKVKQRPGKPFWFGCISGKTLVFALPGNPVSALTCCYRYVIPPLKTIQGGESAPVQFARLSQPYQFSKELTYFLPVVLRPGDDGVMNAEPVTVNGSGDWASLAKSDAVLQLRSDMSIFPEGYTAPMYAWAGSIACH